MPGIGPLMREGLLLLLPWPPCPPLAGNEGRLGALLGAAAASDL